MEVVDVDAVRSSVGTVDLLSFLERMPDAGVLVSADGVVRHANAAAVREFRGALAELLGTPAAALVEDADALRSLLEEGVRSGAARTQLGCRRRDGSAFPAEATVTAVSTGADAPAWLSFRGLGDGPRSEAAEQAAVTFQQAPFAIALSRMPDMRIVDVNPAFSALFEFSREEALGKTSIELGITPAEDRARVSAEFQANGRVRNCECTRRARSGRECRISLNVDRVTVGGVGHVLTFVQDITDRHRAEEALRRSEEHARRQAAELEAILGCIADGVVVYDQDGRILRFNPAALPLLQGVLDGRDLPAAERARGRRALFAEDGSPLPVEESPALRAARKGEVVRDMVMGTEINGGARQWHRFSASPLVVGGEQRGAVVSFTDITARRAVEEELLSQRRLVATIIDSTPVLIGAVDLEDRIILANQAYADFVGHPTEELLGKRPWELIPGSPADTISGRNLAVARTGRATSQEEEVPTPDRGTRVFLATRFPIRDSAGTIRAVGRVATDITELKQAVVDLRASEERTRQANASLEAALEVTRRTEEKLRQAQKMEAVGRLAGGVAHDFNNILTVILSNTEMVADALAPADPLRAEVLEIGKAGERASALTRQLLAFSRKQVLEPRVVSVNELLTGLDKMLRRLIGEDVELAMLLLPRVHLCLLDPGQFEQVILNLVVNARDAMRDGGRLTIETSNVMLDHSYATEHPETVPGPHVLVSVSDTGVGMTREVQARLFEPFFTTKEAGRGTGLGLSTVYGIVRQSGGMIWVYSEPGQGTTFKLYFPRAAAERAEPLPAPAAARNVTGKESILLVEDDDQVRGAVALILRRSGYHVIDASNGGEALLICEQHGGRIQLLLTDIVMPKLNGRKLAERLKQVRPDLRVVFMSGYTENAIVHHGVLDSGVDFLQKPITPDALLHKVREVLDRPGEK